MNKLVLLALLGSCLLAVAGAEDDASQKNLEESKLSLGLAGEKTETLAETKRRRNKSTKKKDKKGKRKARKSRKNNKGKKGTKKGKKRGRKGKKGGKGKKRRKGKKGRKGRKGKKGSKRGRKGRRNQARNTTISTTCTTCLDNAMKYLKTEKDLASNYLAQKKRIERQNKTGDKKSGKKGLFGPVLTRLADAGGGNKSNLSCFGSNTNSIAKQLTNLSTTLGNCESTINKSCNSANFPLPENMTQVLLCESTINSFLAQTAVCLKLSGSAACSCWENSTLATQNTFLKTCSLKTEAAAVAKQKGYCTGNFSVCRKYEDDVVTAIYACSQDPAKLVYKAAQLSKNKDALTKVKTAIASITGSGRKSTRTERATVTTCSAFLIVVKVVITMVSQQPSSPNIEVECNKVSSATPTCSDAEKAALTAEVVNIDSAIEMVGDQLEAVNSDVMTQSGSTPSAAALAAATSEGATANATATTAASGRRRRQLLQGLLSKKKKLD